MSLTWFVSSVSFAQPGKLAHRTGSMGSFCINSEVPTMSSNVATTPGQEFNRALVCGALAMAVGSALYLLASSVPYLVIARLAVGAGEGAVYTAGATWAVDLAPDDRRGLALGMFGLAVWGGLSLGPVAGELLRSGLGYDAVWILTAALPLAGALIAMRLPEPAFAGSAGMARKPSPIAL